MNVTEYTETLETLIKYAHWEYKREDNTQDLQDLVHEIVDGHARIIYTKQSWDFVSFVRFVDSFEYEEAQSMLNDIGEHTSDLDTLMSQMAYWIMFNIVYGAVQERLEAQEEDAK